METLPIYGSRRPTTSWPSVDDPDETWARLSTIDGPAWCEERETWIVHTPRDILEVTADPFTYSNNVPSERNPEHDFLLTVDPPHHTLERRLFIWRFASALRRTSERAGRIVSDIGDRLPRESDVDLLEQFCGPIAHVVRVEVLGAASVAQWEPTATLISRAAALLGGPPAPLAEHTVAATTNSPIHQLRQDLLDLGRCGDVVDGQMLGLACALLVALEDTLRAATALALAEPSRQRRSGEGSLGDTPILGLYRTVTRPTRLATQRPAPGERLFIAFAAANHASRRLGQRRDFSFGSGIHACPARQMVNRVVAAAASYGEARFEIGGEGRLPIVPHSHFRSPGTLRATVVAGGRGSS